MAPGSQGNPGHQGHHGLANGGPDGRPPPSTLAAQLVQTITTSARSSTRPDETSELKRLIAVIERIKNKPEALKTNQEHIEHNHMLIYVCTHVALDGLKWDEPFANHAKLRADALKAMDFIQVTIRETPAVLKYSTDGTSFLFRGQGPLWLWLFPRVLRMLGLGPCLDMSPVIEDFCRSVIISIHRNGFLWDLRPTVTSYFQGSISAILALLKEKCSSEETNAFELQLPSNNASEVFMPLPTDPFPQDCYYTIHGIPQAVHHAMSLLSIIRNATLPSEGLGSSGLVSQHVVWLLDSLFSLFELRVHWRPAVDIPTATFVEFALDISNTSNDSCGFDAIACQKLYATLVLFCAGAVENPRDILGENEGSSKARQHLCVAFIRLAQAAIKHKPIARLIKGQLLAPLRTLTAENVALGPGTDFSRSALLLEQVAASPGLKSSKQHIKSSDFKDVGLARQVVALGLESPPDQPAPGPSLAKRRRLAVEPAALAELLESLRCLLPSNPPGMLSSLDDCVIDSFPRLHDRGRCALIDALSRLSCAADNTLRIQPNSDPSHSLRCSFCSNTTGSRAPPQCLDEGTKSAVSSIFDRILRLPSFLESRRPRVVAMVSLRRILRHSKDPELWDLERSGPGHWCLQSLQSSIRELRLAAGRALGVFLGGVNRPEIGEDILQRNRANALAVLKSLSDKNISHLHETCISAWGQVGRVVPDEELNLVLVKLLDYLGHRNMIVSAFAFNEVLSLAHFRRTNPRRLFAPFWRNLAFSAVKDLVSKPQTTRMVAELLQMSVPDLLCLLQTHAIPWLVLTKKREVIQKIGEARGDSDIWETCCDSSNLSAILSLLLVQDVPDIEDHAMTLFRCISPHFDRFTLVELLQSEPLLTGLELFKASAAADEARKHRIRNALSLMANMLLTDKEKRPKRGHHIGRYFQHHALGLTARLSEVINNTAPIQPPVQEQRLCIMAMEEMIRVCESYVRIARPQISASILSALAYDELRSAAFSCWSVLLMHMEDEDVQVLLETTFFIIDHYWQSFDQATRDRSIALITFLLDICERIEIKRERDIAEHKCDAADRGKSIRKLPSLGHIKELAGLHKRLESMRKPVDKREAFVIFAERLTHENSGVVLQTLSQLTGYLEKNQSYLQTSALSEQPDSVILILTRALLDCSAKYNGMQPDIARLCAECIGLVGCLDSNRLESNREEKQFVVTDNFDDAAETTDFIGFMLETVLVKSFLSATDTRYIGFLSFAMQELLNRCDFKLAYFEQGKGTSAGIYRKWLALGDTAREVLAPLLTSGYNLAPMAHQPVEYPIFRPGRGYVNWLRAFVLDLLRNGQNPFSLTIFEPLCRVIRVKDVSIAEFLLPYVVVHVVVGQDRTSEFRTKILGELLAILNYEPAEDATYVEREDMKLCYEAVFRTLDYCMRWLQVTRAKHGSTPRTEGQFARIQEVLDAIHPELISRRAVDCKQYARALFHLEPYIWRKQQEDKKDTGEDNRLMKSLQEIYAEIDDPDGLEGIFANFPVVNLSEQILSHKKAGRWTATQTWYEIRLAECPDNVDVQLDLLTCLKESGQHDVLLNYVEGMNITSSANKVVPFAVEASWATGRWQTLEKYLQLYNAGDITEVFNLGVAQALLCLKQGDLSGFGGYIQTVRDKVASTLSYSATTSLEASHDAMLKCHVLTDLEMIAGQKEEHDQQALLTALERRLEVLGAYVSDKQYLLGIRRAAMETMRPKFVDGDISSLWLSTARLARKSGSMHQSFNAVLHALQLGDGSATIENARLLWRDGHHRKAIQVLQGAIANNTFIGQSFATSAPTSSKNIDSQRSLLTARAHLLLAKWQDSAGQTHASALRSQYQLAALTHSSWEKGHYYLGRHYKKLLESEQTLKPDDQSDEYLTGETARLVIENYLRSLLFGTKYLYQTLPRILTLWLDLGAQLNKAPEGKVSLSRELYIRRKEILEQIHDYFAKYLKKLPAYIFYTALAQIVARIAHPHPEVFSLLEKIIVKVVAAHPRQALWSLFACMTNKQQSVRRTRGLQIIKSLSSIKDPDTKKYKLKALLRMCDKLSEQLLLACNNGDFQSNRTTMASITRDLNFNHNCTPCPLVVPIESCLTATLPTLTDNVMTHEAFSQDVVTIGSFLDDVLVLGSLAKPRKLTARGSNGKLYGLLIKPKDDLRTDQRLMEFNSMINRSLKRDAESSRRQLYIKTYAVTPLSEECGIIEWVDGLKTIRDILLAKYKTRGIVPSYGNLAQLMKEAITSDDNMHLFTETVLGMFPPVLPDWFISQFPNPSAWFAARLRYTRSCAVMSMVGTILGLGDRHGENVLLEEGNGGVFHVDFNCLFDKGLTFAQPERVPFRLTHNMVAAMGIYGCEGPFRQCSELTLRILRQQEETLMTILEAFIYDPTLDLQRDKKRKSDVVKLNPTSVVESIRRKVRGLLPDESIPLGVEGQVEELIKQAVNPKNLAAMYIGWCPFL